jgi:hypothetical protein
MPTTIPNEAPPCFFKDWKLVQTGFFSSFFLPINDCS